MVDIPVRECPNCKSDEFYTVQRARVFTHRRLNGDLIRTSVYPYKGGIQAICSGCDESLGLYVPCSDGNHVVVNRRYEKDLTDEDRIKLANI